MSWRDGKGRKKAHIVYLHLSICGARPHGEKIGNFCAIHIIWNHGEFIQMRYGQEELLNFSLKNPKYCQHHHPCVPIPFYPSFDQCKMIHWAERNRTVDGGGSGGGGGDGKMKERTLEAVDGRWVQIIDALVTCHFPHRDNLALAVIQIVDC